HVLESDSLGGVDFWPLRGWPVQRRSASLRHRHQLEAGVVAHAGAVLPAAEFRAFGSEGRGGARLARSGRTCTTERCVRVCVHQRSARRRHAHFHAAGLQMKQSGSTLRFIVAVFLLLAAAVAIGLQRDRVYAENLAAPDDLLYVRSGKAMSHAALSYNAILSDVYWIRAIQHFGYSRMH